MKLLKDWTNKVTIVGHRGVSNLSTADRSSAASQSVFYNDNQRSSFTHKIYEQVGQMS